MVRSVTLRLSQSCPPLAIKAISENGKITAVMSGNRDFRNQETLTPKFKG
jgi:hypothetical protein